MALIHTYYSTFISGFSDVVEKALKELVHDAKIHLMLDGLAIYETSINHNEVKALPFLNNSFFLLEYRKGVINFDIKDILIPSDLLKKHKTFRIIISKENTLTSIPKQQLEKIEKNFAKKLHLQVDRAKPDVEIWFSERSEGYSFCGIRLTKKPSTDKYLQKGQLRPELAWLLCYISEPSKEDVFLDPFAGHGSIPVARKLFPSKRIIASDNSPSSKAVQIEKWDALRLPLESDSIDKIVTDPPWGMFEKESVETMYPKMLQEFSRVLKINGLMVILTAQKELMEKLINASSTFSLLEQYNILVSGKKAGVYKLRKGK